MYCKKFKPIYFEGKQTCITFIESKEGGDVPVQQKYPFKGLDAESFYPMNVIASGGKLVPSPKLANEGISAVDRTVKSVENVIETNQERIEFSEKERAMQELLNPKPIEVNE